MIKVQPYDNANVSFNGNFYKNILLDKAIKYSSNTELMRFKEHLKQMANCFDNRNFRIESKLNKSFLGKKQELRLVMNSKNSKTVSYVIGEELSIDEKPFADNCYTYAMKKINEVLNRFYPINDPVENRAILIRIIDSYLKSQ